MTTLNKIANVFILLGLIVLMATAWAEIYSIRDHLQTLRNENDLMMREIERNAKMLAAMDFKLYGQSIPGK